VFKEVEKERWIAKMKKEMDGERKRERERIAY